MYLEQPQTFAETFRAPEFLEQEREQEQEHMMMKAFYPREALRIQEIVEQECDKLEYEGSMMYDEYLDKYQVEQLKARICRIARRKSKEAGAARSQETAGKSRESVEAAERRPEVLGGTEDSGQREKEDSSQRDLAGILLCQEIGRRRCRRRRCRRCF